MKRIILVSLVCMFASASFAQAKKPVVPQKIALLPDVFLLATWCDSIKVDSLYSFQLIGHTGKIANIKVKLAYGSIQQTANSNYKIKLNSNDKTMDLSFTKLDPISKENKVLKQIVLPAKK